jgi:hypothetical protein
MDNGVKKPWLSKTIILNFILGAIAAAIPFVPALHVVSDWISANVALVGVVWSALNIALRFITKDKIVLVD